MPLRVWARLRRPLVQEWERSHCREYFWSTQGRSAERCAWHQSAIDEAAGAYGIHTTSFLADVVKCYENVPHDVLLSEAVATEFPLTILRVALLSYTAARRIVRDGAYSMPVHATRTVLAGCTHATALLKCLLMRSLDHITALWSGAKLRVVVDDITMQCVGKRAAVERQMVGAAMDLVNELEGRLRLPISATKTVVMSSAPGISQNVVRSPRRRGLRFCAAKHSRLLGVDYACGGRRGVGVLRSRLSTPRSRLGRYRTLRRAGARTVGLAKTGAKPSITFGATVTGISDSMFKQARRLVAAAAGCAGNGRSITLSMLLSDGSSNGCLDPAFAFTEGPAKAWAREIWDGIIPFAVLDRSMQRASASLHRARQPWRRVRGPAGALLLTLRRIGWTIPHARCFRSELGDSINLLDYSPHDVGLLVHRGVLRWLWKLSAAELGCAELAEGVALQPITAILRRPPAWATARRVGLLRSSVEVGQWAHSRLAKAKFAEQSKCALCGAVDGTLAHRHWGCDGTSLRFRRPH